MAIVEAQARDWFALNMGVVQKENSFDRAICCLTVGDGHRNALGGIHGGVIFSLADIAFAAACNAGDGMYIGLQAEIRYMATAQDCRLTATAIRKGGTKKFAHYEVLVKDGLDNSLALFTGSAYRLSQ